MDAELLAKKVGKELDTIAEKGITSSNLENAYKLIDIYKDIKEIETMTNTQTTKTHKAWNDRTERYFNKIEEGLDDYSEACSKESEERMIEGIEMVMNAIVNFVESLIDHAETSQEKEIIRKHANKLKNI